MGNRHIFPKPIGPHKTNNDPSKISSVGPNNASLFEGKSIVGDEFDRSVIS